MKSEKLSLDEVRMVDPPQAGHMCMKKFLYTTFSIRVPKSPRRHTIFSF